MLCISTWFIMLTGLFEERAIVLGKLGRHEQALAIYLSTLGDVPRAIQYCDKVNMSLIPKDWNGFGAFILKIDTGLTLCLYSFTWVYKCCCIIPCHHTLCLRRSWFQIFPSLVNKIVVDFGVKRCKQHSTLSSLHPQNNKHLWQATITAIRTRNMNVMIEELLHPQIMKGYSHITVTFTTVVFLPYRCTAKVQQALMRCMCFWWRC